MQSSDFEIRYVNKDVYTVQLVTLSLLYQTGWLWLWSNNNKMLRQCHEGYIYEHFSSRASFPSSIPAPFSILLHSQKEWPELRGLPFDAIHSRPAHETCRGCFKWFPVSHMVLLVCSCDFQCSQWKQKSSLWWFSLQLLQKPVCDFKLRARDPLT